MISRIRCWFIGHKWKHLFDANVFESNYPTRPVYVKRIYICEKCLASKRLHL